MAHASRPSAADLAAFALVVLLATLIHGWIASHDYYVTTFTDSMDYLFMAEFYRHTFHGGDLGDLVRFYRVTRFPPLFPLLIGIAGGGIDQQQIAACVSAAIAILAVAAVWWWIRAELRSSLAATLVALALLAFPYHFILNLSPVSEPLGILLMATVFTLLATPQPSRSRLLLAGLLIGITPLARTAMLPLAIAFVIWLSIRRPLPWRQMVLPVAAAWIPILAWMAYRRSMGAHSYTSYLTAEQFSSAGVVWPDMLWQQPLRLFNALVSAWGAEPSLWITAVTSTLCVLAVAGCVLRISRNKLDGWFFAGYTALILIWPFPEEMTRFLVAVYPCIVLSCVTAARALEHLVGRPSAPWARVAVAVLIAAACLPAVLKYAHRSTVTVPAELLGEKREPGFFLARTDDQARVSAEIYARARLLLTEARELIPADQCMYALPAQLGSLYTRLRVFAYPLDLTDNSPASRERLSRCDYFLVASWSTQQVKTYPLYPMVTLEGWTEFVLMSRLQSEGRTYVASALLKRKRPREESGIDHGPDSAPSVP
jgi:hypothetical protein